MCNVDYLEFIPSHSRNSFIRRSLLISQQFAEVPFIKYSLTLSLCLMYGNDTVKPSWQIIPRSNISIGFSQLHISHAILWEILCPP